MEPDLSKRHLDAAKLVEKTAAKLRKLNTSTLRNLIHFFEDCGTADGEMDTERLSKSIIEHVIEEKGDML